MTLNTAKVDAFLSITIVLDMGGFGRQLTDTLFL